MGLAACCIAVCEWVNDILLQGKVSAVHLKILCVCDYEWLLDFHVARSRSSPTRPPQSWEQEEARKETYSHYVFIYLIHFSVLVHYIQKSVPLWPQSGVSGFISSLKSNMFLSLYCDHPSPNPEGPAQNELEHFQSLPPLPLSPIAALSVSFLSFSSPFCMSPATDLHASTSLDRVHLLPAPQQISQCHLRCS